MMQIKRITRWMQRQVRSRRLGVKYSRDKYWRMPTAIMLRGHREILSAPKELGTRIAFKDIFLDDAYGLTKLKQRVKTILDIGAHVGLFSLYARMLYPEATIHAYEPNLALREYLQQQAKIGNFENFSQAIGQREGKVTLSIGSDSVLTRTVVNPDGDVPMVSIWQALQRLGGRADILKLDCEGAEWDILMDKVSMCSVRFLTLEYHLSEHHTLDELLQLLRNYGFEIVFCHKDGPDNGRIWADRG
jgi:FkbM family methyltransferase